jgi:threonyl-tRNA synthetase
MHIGVKGLQGKKYEHLLIAQVDNNGSTTTSWDVTRPLESTGVVKPIYGSFIDNPKIDLELADLARSSVWHSSAHLLGWAMESLFGDDLLLVDGPALPNKGNIGGGYFYDGMLVKDGKGDVERRLDMAKRMVGSDVASVVQDTHSPLLQPKVYQPEIDTLLSSLHDRIYHTNESHFTDIESRMKQHSQTNSPFERLVVSRSLAAFIFAYNPLKLAILSRIPENEPITLYRIGDFIDLCRGPHVPHTGHLKHTKLLRTGAAQWLNVPGGHLSRVVGITFPAHMTLTNWEKTQKEAALRDHRVVGKQQGLFYMHHYAPGSAFFLPHGTRIASRLMEMVRAEYRRFGFEEVVTPLLFNKDLWVKSGHWENYKEDMFIVTGGDDQPRVSGCGHHHHDHKGDENGGEAESQEEIHGLKPMNCPGHCVLFGHKTYSYRELPVRFAEFSPLHR